MPYLLSGKVMVYFKKAIKESSSSDYTLCNLYAFPPFLLTFHWWVTVIIFSLTLTTLIKYLKRLVLFYLKPWPEVIMTSYSYTKSSKGKLYTIASTNKDAKVTTYFFFCYYKPIFY